MRLVSRFLMLLSCVGFLWMGANVAFADKGIVPFVTVDTFLSDVIHTQKPVLIQFEAQWCPYCRKMQPSLNEFYQQSQGQVTVRRVDIDKEPALAAQFGIKQLPTLVLIKNGKEVDYQARVMTAKEIKKWIDDVL